MVHKSNHEYHGIRGVWSLKSNSSSTFYSELYEDEHTVPSANDEAKGQWNDCLKARLHIVSKLLSTAPDSTIHSSLLGESEVFLRSRTDMP